MLITDGQVFRLASALAIGLLIGAERERRKGEGPARSPAGIRTFAVAALLGGVSFLLGGEIMLAVTTLALAGFCSVAYWRSHEKDPGLTSETALLLTCGAQIFRRTSELIENAGQSGSFANGRNSAVRSRFTR